MRSSATRVLTVETTKKSQRGCRTWSDAVMRKIIADKFISVVFTTAYSSAYEWASPTGERMPDPATTGFTTILEAAPSRG